MKLEWIACHDMQNCLLRVLMHGHNMQAIVQYNTMRVMAAHMCAQVPVFEKAHALMQRIHITCNGKYTENC